MSSSSLDSFIERVMRIRVLRMNGAGAGIIGSSSVEFGVVQELQKSALQFATEYRKPSPDQATLRETTAQLSGVLQMLGVLSILSEQETNELVQQLHELFATISNTRS